MASEGEHGCRDFSKDEESEVSLVNIFLIENVCEEESLNEDNVPVDPEVDPLSDDGDIEIPEEKNYNQDNSLVDPEVDPLSDESDEQVIEEAASEQVDEPDNQKLNRGQKRKMESEWIPSPKKEKGECDVEEEDLMELEMLEKAARSLEHSSRCRADGCRDSSCLKMKKILGHMRMCTKRATECTICGKVRQVGLHHARKCLVETCPVIVCNHLKQMLAKPDDDEQPDPDEIVVQELSPNGSIRGRELEMEMRRRIYIATLE